MLNENRLHPFYFQRVQALKPADYPFRLNFCKWVMQQCALQLDYFISHVLFTDESTFSCEGIFNAHNSHVWATDNPHATRPRAYQQRFCVNVWAGIVNDFLIGPYLLPTRLNGESYLIFWNRCYQICWTMLRSPFVTVCGFSMMGRQSTSALMCALTWMPRLGLDGLDVVDRPLANLISRFIEPRLLFMGTSE